MGEWFPLVVSWKLDLHQPHYCWRHHCCLPKALPCINSCKRQHVTNSTLQHRLHFKHELPLTRQIPLIFLLRTVLVVKTMVSSGCSELKARKKWRGEEGRKVRKRLLVLLLWGLHGGPPVKYLCGQQAGWSSCLSVMPMVFWAAAASVFGGG